MSQDQQYLGPDEIVARKQRYLIPCVYHFYRKPPQIVRGEGVWLYDSEGRRYLDLYSGVSVHALGHCHPEVTAAICRQIRTLQHTTTIYLTQPIVRLAESLAGVLPGDLCRTFFCASGSEANEGAALLAALHTGRGEFLAFQNGLHGRTKLGMSLTGLSFWRTDPNPVGGITLVPPPHCSRCPFGRRPDRCDRECVGAVETAICTSTSGRPAAMFVEPIQGNGGIVTPPPDYFPRLKPLLEKYEVLLIADEVQTGFGRTGRWFAMEHWGVCPDILTGGKALGGGTPVGFFSTTDAIAASYTRPGASTFGGNPVTAVAGLEVIQILRRDGLIEKSARVGAALRSRLESIAKRIPVIREVRGLGLMLGLEIQSMDQRPPAEITDQVLEELKDRGFLAGKTGAGRDVITFMPPLIAEESVLDEATRALEETLESL
jgi:4-aminobutyrate aminotransferase/4-aminobutyrate aminotransferase/(S)-3-amino-2-methylpropionate transaminase